VTPEVSPRTPQSKTARNERRKAASGTLIAIGVALLGAAFFQPIATGNAPQPLMLAAIAFMFIASQAFAHYILSRMED